MYTVSMRSRAQLVTDFRRPVNVGLEHNFGGGSCLPLPRPNCVLPSDLGLGSPDWPS
jgi:hypothetical protein